MAYDFYDERAAVTVDGKSGYIDNTGKIVIAPVYSYARWFSEGLAAVSTGYGGTLCDTGFLDRDGGFAIQPRFGETGTFRSGLCLVTTEHEVGYIDRTGEFV